MSEEEIESDDEHVQYDEEESSDDGLRDASGEGDEESEEGEEGDDEEADEDDTSEPEAPLATLFPAQSQQPQIYVPTSSRSSSPTLQRRDLFRSDIAAKSYIIEPLAAFPHPVPTHSLASSLCLTHLLTGSDDGFIRDYDVYASANGKTLLTAPQRAHTGMTDTNLKAGALRSWWENLDDGVRPLSETSLSPVHSMTMQADALWGLSGTDSGNINLFTVRHEPGRIHHVLRGHRGPVSSLSLSNDESSLFSAGWDSNALHWDLNTGEIARKFSSHGAQLTTIAVRPLGAPIPTNYGTWTVSGATAHPKAEPATPQPMQIEESQSTIAAAVPSPQVSEDAAGESDNDFDPLFDDEAEPPLAPQLVPAPPIQNGGMALPSGGGALQLHMPGSNQYAMSSPPPPTQAQQLAHPPSVLPKKETPILDPVRYNDFSPDILMTASIDGQVTLWDRRVPSFDGRGMGRLEGNERSPP